jgi:hypothetical protein
MRGNNRVNYLDLSDDTTVSKEDWLEVFQALAENEGITRLILYFSHVHATIWTALWQSVSRHPKLERIALSLLGDYAIRTHYMNEAQLRATRPHDIVETDAQRTLRTQAMVDALRINTVLLDIELHREKFDKVLLNNDVYPRLLANKYRPRVAAIANERVSGVVSCSGGPWPRWLALA